MNTIDIPHIDWGRVKVACFIVRLSHSKPETGKRMAQTKVVGDR
jgi:hypothetical protein